MMVERRFANRFLRGEEAHAFEVAVRGAALDAGLSVGPGGTEDEGRLGSVVTMVLLGEAAALDGFAKALHDGTRLAPAM